MSTFGLAAHLARGIEQSDAERDRLKEALAAKDAELSKANERVAELELDVAEWREACNENAEAWEHERDCRRAAEARLAEAEKIIPGLLPENCGPGDDPSGGRRPSFEKCAAARSFMEGQKP